jgi:hypothetical protein
MVSVALQCICVWFVVINEAYHIIISEGGIYSELFLPFFVCFVIQSSFPLLFVCFVMWTRMKRIRSSVFFLERAVPKLDGLEI